MWKKTERFIKFLACAVVLWTVGFILFLGTIFLHTAQSPDITTDAIVVLTGGKGRIEKGLELFAKGKAAHLFISGVHKSVSMREIKNKWTGETSLPPCCISLGYEATTTQQNAQEVKQWLEHEGYRSIRLITSDFHVNRSLIELKHALDDVKIITTPITQTDAEPNDLWFWIVSLKEYNKTLVRWFSLILTPKTSNAHTAH